MIITCNNCESRFNIDERLIKPQGSKVKCSKCQTVFTVLPPQKEEAAPPPPPPAPPKPASRLLDDDEDSGVDIEKDFVRKSPRPTRKPMFEEPDVVGAGSDANAQPVAPAPPVRTPRRAPRSAAMSGGMTTGAGMAALPSTAAVHPPVAAQAPAAVQPPVGSPRQRPVRRSVPSDGLPPRRPSALETPAVDPMPMLDNEPLNEPLSAPPVQSTPVAPVPPVKEAVPETAGRAPRPAKAVTGKGKTAKSAKPGKPAKAGKLPKAAKEKSGSGIGKKLLLLLLLIIVLLAVAVFVLPKIGVQVPFVENLGFEKLLGGSSGGTTTEPEDDIPVLPNRGGGQTAAPTGGVSVSITPEDKNGILNLYMNPEEVNSGSIDNIAGGVRTELTIVEGRIFNNYDEPRTAIKVVGRLFDNNYEMVQEKIVYAGNLLTEEELVTLGSDEMEALLMSRNGRLTVAPKSNIPFMVVFRDTDISQKYNYECIIVSSERAPANPQPMVTP